MKKSKALRGVDVSTIEKTIDDAMEYLPSDLDLTLPENRAKVRNWMVRVCGVVVTEAAMDFSKAAARAIDEAAALAIDPRYHEERKRSRQKYQAQRALIQLAKPKTRAEAAFERMTGDTVKM